MNECKNSAPAPLDSMGAPWSPREWDFADGCVRHALGPLNTSGALYALLSDAGIWLPDTGMDHRRLLEDGEPIATETKNDLREAARGKGNSNTYRVFRLLRNRDSLTYAAAPAVQNELNEARGAAKISVSGKQQK